MTANRVLDYQMLGHAFHAAGGDGQLILLDTARALVAGQSPQPPSPPEDGPEPGSLLDPAYLRSLAEAREHRAHQDAAWNEQYDTYLELANAHGAALILAAGLRAAGKTADPDASRLLTDLCLLHALESVHESSGRLLANKLLTSSQVLEIPEAMNTLCDRLLPNVATLIDAFDIPGSLLGDLSL
jgi:acyl-CoA oxidase